MPPISRFLAAVPGIPVRKFLAAKTKPMKKMVGIKQTGKWRESRALLKFLASRKAGEDFLDDLLKKQGDIIIKAARNKILKNEVTPPLSSTTIKDKARRGGHMPSTPLYFKGGIVSNIGRLKFGKLKYWVGVYDRIPKHYKYSKKAGGKPGAGTVAAWHEFGELKNAPKRQFFFPAVEETAEERDELARKELAKFLTKMGAMHGIS